MDIVVCGVVSQRVVELLLARGSSALTGSLILNAYTFDTKTLVCAVSHLLWMLMLRVLRQERMEDAQKEQKKHQQKHSGPKAERKKSKRQGGATEEKDERRRNPKAFAVQSAVRMAKTFHRSAF